MDELVHGRDSEEHFATPEDSDNRVPGLDQAPEHVLSRLIVFGAADGAAVPLLVILVGASVEETKVLPVGGILKGRGTAGEAVANLLVDFTLTHEKLGTGSAHVWLLGWGFWWGLRRGRG